MARSPYRVYVLGPDTSGRRSPDRRADEASHSSMASPQPDEESRGCPRLGRRSHGWRAGRPTVDSAGFGLGAAQVAVQGEMALPGVQGGGEGCEAATRRCCGPSRWRAGSARRRPSALLILSSTWAWVGVTGVQPLDLPSHRGGGERPVPPVRVLPELGLLSPTLVHHAVNGWKPNPALEGPGRARLGAVGPEKVASKRTTSTGRDARVWAVHRQSPGGSDQRRRP